MPDILVGILMTAWAGCTSPSQSNADHVWPHYPPFDSSTGRVLIDVSVQSCKMSHRLADQNVLDWSDVTCEMKQMCM